MLGAILRAIGAVGPGVSTLDRYLPFTFPGPRTFIVALLLTLPVVAFAILPGPAPASAER